MKTFHGRSLEDILPEIRAELGSEAVVLSQRPKISGGVGGFFGKRSIEVVASDRMPTDSELVELENRDPEDVLADVPPTTEHLPKSGSTLDLVDDWSPDEDEELAHEFGSVLRRADGAAAAQARLDHVAQHGVDDELLGQLQDAARRATGRPQTPITRAQGDNAFAPLSAAEVAQAPAGNSAAPPMLAPAAGARLQTTPYGRSAAAPQIAAGPGGGTALRMGSDAPIEPIALQTRSGMHPQDSTRDQAQALAARAHQAIAEATAEIEQQLAYTRAQRPIERGSAFRAEVRDARTPSAGETASLPRDLAHEIDRNAPTDYLVQPQHLHASTTASQTPHADQSVVAEARGLEASLHAAGVDREVAQSVMGLAVSHRLPFSGTQELTDIVRDLVAELIRTESGWTPVGRAHRLAVVGASGSGKSTVIAKLAEGYSRGAGYAVGVISIALPQADPTRTPERDPLLERMGLDVRTVTDPQQLPIVMERMADLDVILFDTPSAAYLDRDAAAHVARCLQAARVDDVHAVIPLATSVREAQSVVDHFRPLGLNRLVVSKLDESRFAGQLLNFGFRFGLPITFLSDGPRIPEDLRIASASEIAELVVAPTHARS